MDFADIFAAKKRLADAENEADEAEEASYSAADRASAAEEALVIARRDYERALMSAKATTVADLVHLRALDCTALRLHDGETLVSDGHAAALVPGDMRPAGFFAPEGKADGWARFRAITSTMQVIGRATTEAIIEAAREDGERDPRTEDAEIVAIDGVPFAARLLRKWVLPFLELAAVEDVEVLGRATDVPGDVAAVGSPVCFRGVGWRVYVMPIRGTPDRVLEVSR